MSDSDKDRSSPKLIREFGDIQIFQSPESGEEFTTTISRPLPLESVSEKRVSIQFHPSLESGAKEAYQLIQALHDVAPFTSKDVLQRIRLGQTIEVCDVPQWKADDILSAASQTGLILHIVDPED